jgi:hypothetical protein
MNIQHGLEPAGYRTFTNGRMVARSIALELPSMEAYKLADTGG